MKPAKTTRSTPCSLRAFTASRSHASRSLPNIVWSITTAGTPSAFARSSTAAPGTLHTSTAISTGTSPRLAASAIAWKFVPRPDASTPTFARPIVPPSVLEEPHAGKDHRDPVLIGGVDDLRVPDASARLEDRRHARLRGLVDPVAEGEERVAAEDGA